MTSTLTPSDAELALCANRRIGHTWDDPANQHWEEAEPVRVGRRRVARVRCVGTCDRCGSERIEPFFVDAKRHLAERDTMWYRHSTDYSRRERIGIDELNWVRIPASVIRSLAGL